MERGYLQIYTGDGKGKTTAAIGLAARAVGAGLSVRVVQFIKSMQYAELKALERLGVAVNQFGRGCFIDKEPADEDKQLALCGIDFARRLMSDASTDLLILDEINIALRLGLLELSVVLDLVASRPLGLELICTGRGAPQGLIDAADLVTEMVKIKHYYDVGVLARDGIER